MDAGDPNKQGKISIDGNNIQREITAVQPGEETPLRCERWRRSVVRRGGSVDWCCTAFLLWLQLEGAYLIERIYTLIYNLSVTGAPVVQWSWPLFIVHANIISLPLGQAGRPSATAGGPMELQGFEPHQELDEDDKVELPDLDLELDDSSPPGMDDAKSHPGFSYTFWVVQHNSEVELFVICPFNFFGPV